MEVEKHNLFVVKRASPLVGETRLALPQLKPRPLSEAKTKPKPKTKLEDKGISRENKKIQDIFYAESFVKTSRK